MSLRSMHEASRPSREGTKQEKEQDIQLMEELSNRVAEQEQEILELSSKCSALMSELQKRSVTIVELNEQIEKLNESDLVLKENEKLKEANHHIAREAENVVLSIRAEYKQKVKELANQKSRAEQRESEAESLKHCLQDRIKAEAEEMSRDRRKSLEKEYQAKKAGYESVLLGSLLYGILCTGFTAWRSETFVSDFKAFFTGIWTLLCLCAENVLKLAKWASQIGDMIPQPVVAGIAHWAILIATVVLAGGGIAFLLFRAGKYAYVHYKDGYWDTISLAVALISLAVAVFFAEPIRAVLPVNLLLLMILVHIVYVGVRCYEKWTK